MRDARIIIRQYENLVEELERQYREYGYLSNYMLRKIVSRERRFMKDYEMSQYIQTALFPGMAKPMQGGEKKNGETDRTAEATD